MATWRSRRVSRARYTSPMPPAPSAESIWYGPMRVPAGEGQNACRGLYRRADAGRDYSRVTPQSRPGQGQAGSSTHRDQGGVILLDVPRRGEFPTSSARVPSALQTSSSAD